MNPRNNMIAVIGMGYVGLPLAVALAKKNYVVGFDIDKIRVNSLKKGIDQTKEILKKQIINSKKLKFSDKIKEGFIYDLKYMLNKKEDKNYFRI